MIIGDDAVSAMYEYICNNLSKIGVKKGNVFKYKRPKKLDSDSYIVINHLPFVHESEIENGMINVNVHVRRHLKKAILNDIVSELRCKNG